MGSAAATLPGYATAHSSACMPPIDPPATASSLFMPRESMSIFCNRTMSARVTTGNDIAHGSPVSGLMEEGPVVPRHPLNTLEQITKYLSVSKPFPGPIMLDHQPPSPAACASPENAWATRIAFDFASFRVP